MVLNYILVGCPWIFSISLIARVGLKYVQDEIEWLLWNRMKTFTGLKPLLFVSIVTTALVDRSRHIKTRSTICRSVHWRVPLVLLSKTRLTIWLSWCWYRPPLPNERVFGKPLQKKSSIENELRLSTTLHHTWEVSLKKFSQVVFSESHVRLRP